MRTRVGWGGFVGALLAAMTAAAVPSAAEACGGPPPYAPFGLPRPAATGVSTATSMVVVWQWLGRPDGLALEVAGQDVPLAEPFDLGPGAEGFNQALSFWRVRPATASGLLAPNAEHVLTATYEGSTVEVTRFTTAAGYDKVEGVAPIARGLQLWRVRYPVSEIGSGNCVFAEYHGFLTVDYDPATVPNTPPTSVVHTFHLAPKTGGGAQSFNYVGDSPFAGLAPSGDHPLPDGLWKPELDPTREYCLTISALGDGDIGRPGLQSQPVCARVAQLSASGAPPSPVITGAGGAGDGGGGCNVAGEAGAVPALVLGSLAFMRALRRPARGGRDQSFRRSGLPGVAAYRSPELVEAEVGYPPLDVGDIEIVSTELKDARHVSQLELAAASLFRPLELRDQRIFGRGDEDARA